MLICFLFLSSRQGDQYRWQDILSQPISELLILPVSLDKRGAAFHKLQQAEKKHRTALLTKSKMQSSRISNT